MSKEILLNKLEKQFSYYELVDEMQETINYSKIVDFLENEKDQKIADLEAKLAEKDAERELDNSFWKQECDSLQKTLAEKDKEVEQVTSKLQASYEKDPLLKKGSKVIYDGAIWSITSHKQNKQLGLVEVKLKFEKNIGYDNKAKIIFCDDIVDTSNKELKGKVEDER